MTTIWFHDEGGFGHATPDGHPERPARLRAVVDALSPLDLLRRAAPDCADADILLCHPQGHLDALVAAAPSSGAVALDADTWMSPGTLAAARHAVGGAVAAVDAVLSGEAANAFVGCRPPGHHAERTTPMGFCLFGTSAIAAMHALERHGLARVAIVDFDVHHGNGTQDLLWDEGRAFFASSHQMPLYPGSGAAAERGAHGQIVNVPLAEGTGGAAMRAAWDGTVLPALDAFAPELVIVSAGFDAATGDPLAGLDWTTGDFAWITGRLCDAADRHCGGRIVSTLEGGYDLPSLGAGVAAHVGMLRERGG